MAEGPASSPRPWEGAVTVREDRALEQELLARLKGAGGERSVGVTDLLALRRAFYRTVTPGVPIPAPRQARLDQGRSIHRAIGARLAGEGIPEARVRRSGVVGRIDLLGEVPIEVKTSNSLADPERLAAERPDHVEQLGMYCALLGRSVGRLVTLAVGPGSVADVQAVDITFRSVDRLFAEVQRRAALLRSAWSEGRADSLPRCPWFGHGCEFAEASACVCTGNEEPSPPTILEEVDSFAARGEARDRYLRLLSGSLSTDEAPSVDRFRDLLYPRRAYFERTAEEPPARIEVPSSITPDLYARMTEALESGPAGEVARLPPLSSGPEEDVLGFRGRPLLVRTSRAWSRYRAAELVARAPQYALELGLRCAVTGQNSAWVVVGFERAELESDRLQVFTLHFEPLTPFSRLYRDRSRELGEAIRSRDPGRLPACPPWMAPDCPYRPECGCEGAGSRVTR